MSLVRSGRGRVLACAVALAAAAAASPGAAAGQELAGVALGPEGEALADQIVVLHRVGGGAGAFVATDTTDAEGGFRFTLPVQDTAIYFAAMRYDGLMYIGPAAQGGGEPVSDYILRVDAGAEAGAVASALSGRSPAPPAARPLGGTARNPASEMGAYLIVGLLALTAAGVFLFAAPRYRRHRTRDSLLELARIENELAAGDVDDRAALEAERGRYREQLLGRR